MRSQQSNIACWRCKDGHSPASPASCCSAASSLVHVQSAVSSLGTCLSSSLRRNCHGEGLCLCSRSCSRSSSSSCPCSRPCSWSCSCSCSCSCPCPCSWSWSRSCPCSCSCSCPCSWPCPCSCPCSCS